ncbi:hypothetical protein UFOVP97_48 [uncultured Caudovirales phage]|uniref:Uncharacterized protein n=1 Tax=uncultured Caudovirales phage TaxID=2100421 RepID=A0A6J5LM39_9CAUD|nr:hypothetical protein UFOVP97_48 [uncultured Caudovirales phage]CAB4134050.1 hypothetical protein UFOVP268_10 [uncultured Caudovirales phage]
MTIKKETLERSNKTVGELALEQQSKPYYEVPVQEFSDAVLIEKEDYMKNIWEAVDRGYKEWNADIFFVSVLSLRERLLSNVFRNKFLPRQTCPTPTYCQTVFKYEKIPDRLELLWTIPDRNSCTMLLQNAPVIEDNDERIVLKNVMDFYDGTLDRRCMQLNGEEIVI